MYIYRLGAYPKLRTPAIMIDGRAIFDPPEGAYTVVALPPGQHEFKVHWSWDAGARSLAFPVTVGTESLYIKISGSFGYTRTEKNLPAYEFGSSAWTMEPDAAEADMKQCCRYVAPRE